MIRVLITDDHALIRRGLRQVLEEGLGGVTVGEAQDAGEALDQIMNQEWDVVVLDITMPGRSGLDILRDIKLAQPNLPVLILSMHPEEQFAVRVLKSGAAGFIPKESAPEELIKAIKKVLSGGRYVTASLAEKMAFDLSGHADRPLHEGLSDREFQVMRLIASGKQVGQIAEQLSLSVKTVSTYRSRVLAKMQLQNNAELTHYAIKHQLVD
jgi:two-component system, NarL family, invasion response regulator UvrY